jgi:hypothetical protein
MSNNRYRIHRFEQWLQHYDAAGNLTENLTNVLADARHWCEHRGQCLAELDRLAHHHYVFERAEPARRRK